MRHCPKLRFPGQAAWFILKDTVLSKYSESLPKTAAPNIGQPLIPIRTQLGRLQLSDFSWKIEEYHRGLKQFCGVERSQVRPAAAQRNHIGLAVRAFLRFEVASLKTGLSRFEAKIRIIRDAIRAYLANPVYALQATA